MTAARPQHAPAPPGSGVTVHAPRVLVANPWAAAAIGRGVDPLVAQQRTAANAYTPVPSSAVVVYRVESGSHRQTGVLVDVPVQDYRDGRIRRHEATEPEQERRLARLTESTGFQRMPVTLLHPDRARLRALVVDLSSADPDVRVTSSEGITHTVWVRALSSAARIVQDEIAALGPLYIADGHHRMAAADRHADGHDGSGSRSEALTAAALFPADEMRILGYHRCVPLPSAARARDVLDALATANVTEHVEERPAAATEQPVPGTVTVRLDGRHHRLRLRPSARFDDVRSALDVVQVDEHLVPAVEAVTGTRRHSLGSGPPGATGDGCAPCRDHGHAAVRFVPHPPTVEQVMAVADAGLTMPAKSTWFDPKASDRVFLRQPA